MDDTYFVISKNGLKFENNASRHFYKHSRKGQIPLSDIAHGDIDRIFKYCRVPENMKSIFIAYPVSLFSKNDADLVLMFRGNYLAAFENLQTLNVRISDKCYFGQYLSDICEAWEEGKGVEFCSDYVNLLKIQLKDFQKHPELVDIMLWFLGENGYCRLF